MKPNPPIKRAKPLIPLSHDHHHGLVVSRRITEGLTRHINPDRITAYVKYFWQNDLQRHFGEEETLVFSLLPEDDDKVHRAVNEHRKLRRYLAQLDNDKSNETSLLQQFADLLLAHIRFEERTLFPHIEHTVPRDILTEAGATLQQNPVEAPACWSDAFWKE